MVTTDFVPDRGDLIWLEFVPPGGHDQAEILPVLVVSPISYNKLSGLCLVFPVTSKIKGYPFEVQVSTLLVSGVVLSDQVKSLDWKARKARFICKADPHVVNEAVALFSTLPA